jgi:hypothetical protein
MFDIRRLSFVNRDREVFHVRSTRSSPKGRRLTVYTWGEERVEVVVVLHVGRSGSTPRDVVKGGRSRLRRYST